MALSAGMHLGPYEVAELLGAGAMGTVYRARRPRSVARSPSRSCGATSPPTRPSQALPARGPRRRRPQPPQHRHGPPHRLPRRPALRRHGATRGRDPPRGPHPALPHPAPGLAWASRSPRASPTPTARASCTATSSPRTSSSPPRGGSRSSTSASPSSPPWAGLRGGDRLEPHQARRADGDGGLHVPGAGAGAASGCAVGPLLLRGGALRAPGRKHPFRRDTVAATLTAILQEMPPPLHGLDADPARGGRDRAPVPGEGTGKSVSRTPTTWGSPWRRCSRRRRARPSCRKSRSARRTGPVQLHGETRPSSSAARTR